MKLAEKKHKRTIIGLDVAQKALDKLKPGEILALTKYCGLKIEIDDNDRILVPNAEMKKFISKRDLQFKKETLKNYL